MQCKFILSFTTFNPIVRTCPPGAEPEGCREVIPSTLPNEADGMEISASQPTGYYTTPCNTELVSWLTASLSLSLLSLFVCCVLCTVGSQELFVEEAADSQDLANQVWYTNFNIPVVGAMLDEKRVLYHTHTLAHTHTQVPRWYTEFTAMHSSSQEKEEESLSSQRRKRAHTSSSSSSSSDQSPHPPPPKKRRNASSNSSSLDVSIG